MPKKTTLESRIERLERAYLIAARAISCCPDIDDHRKWEVEDMARIILGWTARQIARAAKQRGD